MLRLLRHGILLAALLGSAGCTEIESLSNPLIGRWTAEEGGFSLGTYEFHPHSVSAFGFDQEVDYAVSNDTIRVMPRNFGPQLEVTMIDHDTARLATPMTGDLLTLRRVR